MYLSPIARERHPERSRRIPTALSPQPPNLTSRHPPLLLYFGKRIIALRRSLVCLLRSQISKKITEHNDLFIPRGSLSFSLLKPTFHYHAKACISSVSKPLHIIKPKRIDVYARLCRDDIQMRTPLMIYQTLLRFGLDKKICSTSFTEHIFWCAMRSSLLTFPSRNELFVLTVLEKPSVSRLKTSHRDLFIPLGSLSFSLLKPAYSFKKNA